MTGYSNPKGTVSVSRCLAGCLAGAMLFQAEQLAGQLRLGCCDCPPQGAEQPGRAPAVTGRTIRAAQQASRDRGLPTQGPRPRLVRITSLQD